VDHAWIVVREIIISPLAAPFFFGRLHTRHPWNSFWVTRVGTCEAVSFSHNLGGETNVAHGGEPAFRRSASLGEAADETEAIPAHP
jgi:hypothetical protein